MFYAYNYSWIFLLFVFVSFVISFKNIWQIFLLVCVCVCVADEGERKMKKLNEMNRFWVLFNLEEICFPMLFMCCNCSFNGRAISQQESNVIKIYFTRDIDSVFFFILFLTQNLSRLLLILFGLCVLILQSNILVFYFFPFSPILNLTWDDIFLHEKKYIIIIQICSSTLSAAHHHNPFNFFSYQIFMNPYQWLLKCNFSLVLFFIGLCGVVVCVCVCDPMNWDRFTNLQTVISYTIQKERELKIKWIWFCSANRSSLET